MTKCKCGNPNKTGPPSHLCLTCARRRRGMAEWLIKMELPDDEVYRCPNTNLTKD